MEHQSFRIAVIYRTGDLFSTTGRIDTLHCPYCNSIWFFNPDFDHDFSHVNCASCHSIIIIENLFRSAFEPVST